MDPFLRLVLVFRLFESLSYFDLVAAIIFIVVGNLILKKQELFIYLFFRMVSWLRICTVILCSLLSSKLLVVLPTQEESVEYLLLELVLSLCVCDVNIKKV